MQQAGRVVGWELAATTQPVKVTDCVKVTEPVRMCLPFR